MIIVLSITYKLILNYSLRDFIISFSLNCFFFATNMFLPTLTFGIHFNININRKKEHKQKKENMMQHEIQGM